MADFEIRMKILEEYHELGCIVSDHLNGETVILWYETTQGSMWDVLHHEEKALLVLNKRKISMSCSRGSI